MGRTVAALFDAAVAAAPSRAVPAPGGRLPISELDRLSQDRVETLAVSGRARVVGSDLDALATRLAAARLGWTITGDEVTPPTASRPATAETQLLPGVTHRQFLEAVRQGARPAEWPADLVALVTELLGTRRLDVAVRRGRAADLPALSVIAPGLDSEFVRQERDETIVMVAWAGDTPVGTCVVELGDLPVLTSLVVGELWRGRGVGRALVSAAERFGRREGSLTIATREAVPDEYFTRQGYEPAGDVLVKHLPPVVR